MRLVIKDYLLQLKEKDELDLLLCDLLFQMGYITDNKPKTGNRQYGVDIRAYNDNKILLTVVKQGNLNRKNWDSDQNAVRQSLNDIQDTYIEFIKGKDRKKELHIIVASNGVIDEPVRPSWEGYVSHNTTWSGMKVQIEFWNIDKLVDDVQKYLFDEHIFGAEMQSFLRKALYFIDESDYRNEYFECIIDDYLLRLKSIDTPKERRKKLSGLYLACQMIAQYAAEAGIYKIGIMVSEYLIVKYWKYMLEDNKLGKLSDVEWLHKFLSMYEKWNQKYYEAVRYCCEGEDRIPFYNTIEQRLLVYEVLGYLISYAYYLSFRREYDSVAAGRCYEVHASIINLINNHAQFAYAPYDRHIGIVSMLYRLLDCLERTEDICGLMRHQCTCLAHYYLMYHKYPTAADSIEDAIAIDMGALAEDYQTSAFWGTMLEWIVLMDQSELYQFLQSFLKDDLKNVTKCVWFLRSEEESQFYDVYAMNQAGEGIALQLEKTFDKFKEKVIFIMKQYETEQFSFDEYSFAALEFIVCRYYGYLVRVKREE